MALSERNLVVQIGDAGGEAEREMLLQRCRGRWKDIVSQASFCERKKRRAEGAKMIKSGKVEMLNVE